MNNLQIDADLREMFEGAFAGSLATESGFDQQLWSQLDDLGLLRLTGSEESGGAGASWAESAALLGVLAKKGLRTPIAEHDLLAGWLADKYGLATGQVMTACELIGGRADRVPWASEAERVVVVWAAGSQFFVQSVEVSRLRIDPGQNNIGEPRDTVTLDTDTLEGVAIDADTLQEFRLKRAMIRAVQVSAALERALELTVEHVTARVQFGRPLAKFQAVQQLVADMAAEAALARAAVDTALLEAINTEWKGANLAFLVAVARSNAGHSASVVVRNAHQAHGAIGTTLEHNLHHSTRAALAWRGEYGSLASWDDRLTELALQHNGADLWRLIAG